MLVSMTRVLRGVRRVPGGDDSKGEDGFGDGEMDFGGGAGGETDFDGDGDGDEGGETDFDGGDAGVTHFATEGTRTTEMMRTLGFGGDDLLGPDAPLLISTNLARHVRSDPAQIPWVSHFLDFIFPFVFVFPLVLGLGAFLFGFLDSGFGCSTVSGFFTRGRSRVV